MTVLQDGTYTVEYLATVATRYIVRVSLNDDPVGILPYKSPFILQVVDDPGPLSITRTYAEGPNLVESFTGGTSTYTIQLVSNKGIPLNGGGVVFDVVFTCEVRASLLAGRSSCPSVVCTDLFVF